MSFQTRIVGFAVLAAATLSFGFASGANADDTFYYGKWKIADAKPAPWVLPADQLDPNEPKSLIGKTIEVSATAIGGPGDFPCQKPQYQMLEGGPEMLYQGSFESMKDADPSVDMLKLAAQSGFTGDTHFRTIVTGCEYEVDFSFGTDNDTARFALNNYIYTMIRE